MSQRFFVETPLTGSRAMLAGAEAHHLLHVMRARVGDNVLLFDGQGGEWLARVETLGRREVELALVEPRVIDRELPFRLTLGVALPKGDRQRLLVEKATELGVSTLVPLITSRGVAQPTGGTLDRLARGVIEASKQCGRNRLMTIDPPRSFDEFLTDAPGELRLVAHPGGERPTPANWQRAAGCAIAIGPEGGLTDEEVAAAHLAHWRAIDLGPRILRVETAALALASLVATI